MSLLDTLNNPSMMHAAIVHFPVVLFTLAVPVAGLAVALRNQLWVRSMMLVLFALLTLSCWVAEETGEKAQSKVPAAMEQVIWDQINQHEEMAELLKFVAASGVVLSLLALIPHPWFRAGGTLLALCIALAGAILTALTAHYGGDLVYTHGVGTTLLEKRLEAEKAALAAAPGTVPTPPAVDPELVPIREIVMAEAERVSFKNDIWPIIETRCLDCHDGPEGDGGYDVTSVATMSKAGEKGGPGIVPGEPDASSIVKYIRGELKPRMPKKKPAMPEEELHLIRLWIAAGAKDDAAAPTPEAAPEPVENAVTAPATTQPEPVPATPAEAAPVENVVEAAPMPAAVAAPVPVVVEESAPAAEPEAAAPVQEVVEVPPAASPETSLPAEPVEVMVSTEAVLEAPAAQDAPVTPVEVQTVESTPAVMTEQAPEVTPVTESAPEAPVAETAATESAAPAESLPQPAPQPDTAGFDPFASKQQTSAPAAPAQAEAVQMEIAAPVESAPAQEQETEFEPDPAAAGE